jgi:hypothetical protein
MTALTPPRSPHLQVAGPIIQLQTPISRLVIHSLITIVGGPVAGGAIGLLLALQVPIEADPEALAFVLITAGVFAALFSGVGVLLLLSAPLRAARSRVQIDLERGEIQKGTQKLRLGEVVGLRVGLPNPMLKFVGICTSGGSPWVLVSGVPPRNSAEVVELAEYLGRRMGKPVVVESAIRTNDRMGLSTRSAALFCWLPIQGIYLFFALYYGLGRTRRPFVHFHARQSLAQLGATFLLGLPLIGLAVGLAWVVRQAHVPPALGVAVVVPPVLLFAAWNFGSRLVACYWAWKGKARVLPWLRFLFPSPPDDLPSGGDETAQENVGQY